MPTPTPDLSAYRPTGYHPGAGAVLRVLWYAVNASVFAGAWLPLYAPKRALLRLFGAQVGPGVVIKPRVRIKHPWRLVIGAHAWVGEGVWIDNLVEVAIGAHACLSQDAMVLTGNHDYTAPAFDLVTAPVRIGDGAWVGARALVCPGAALGRSTVLTAGSVLTTAADPDAVYAGNPARRVRERVIR